MSRRVTMESKLKQAYAPQRLEVLDESHMHAGHRHEESGHHVTYDGAGETHFRIRIVSAVFAGMSRLDRHRSVNALLAEELANGVHALAIDAAAPGESVKW